MSKTPLFQKHIEHGGKIVDFFGWELPVQYTSIMDEHRSVRERAGIFDVSHMGEIIIKGKDAEAAIQNLITNDITSIRNGQVLYSPMCYADGGVVDDLLVYKFDTTHYLLVVNAANIQKDFEWMKENTSEYQIEVINVSDEYAQIAIQGPLAQEILQKTTEDDISEIKFYRFIDSATIVGQKVIISRTGYTGEDGFEVYVQKEHAVLVWETLYNSGKDLGLMPCGLGARDTLRFEACLPLYGHELSDKINPLEAGLKPFVKLGKDNFIGKDALNDYYEAGIKRKIVGVEMLDKGIPREGYEVFKGDAKIGYVTTGGVAPSLNKNIALVLVNKEDAVIGSEVEIQVRKRKLKAVIVKKPFYNKKYKR